MLVFEFVDSDLKKYMKKHQGELGQKTVRDFGYQLLSGLDFCHQHRIIHRDLKRIWLLVIVILSKRMGIWLVNKFSSKSSDNARQSAGPQDRRLWTCACFLSTRPQVP